MPVLKSTQAPNGATVSFHKVHHVSYNPANATVSMDIASWTTEASYLAEDNLVWMWNVDASPAILADLNAGLAAVAPFDGGTVVADNIGGLDAVKARAWAAIKDARDSAMFGGFTHDGMSFQSDDVSQRNIQGAVQLATLAAASNQPFSIGWTLTDNTTVSLTGDQMIAVGLALGAFVQAQFSKGVALRAQIEAATTPEEVQAIVWA